MALWDKSNTTYPKFLNSKQKRNVVRTPIGWVRISKRLGSPNEILIPQANSSSFAAASIQNMWHSKSSSSVNTAITTTVSFNQPIQKLGGNMKISVANTISGSAKTATSTAVFEGTKLVFTWTPTVAGTYKVQAQTIANNTSTAVSIRSVTANGNTAVSLVISGSVSNTASTIVVS